MTPTLLSVLIFVALLRLLSFLQYRMLFCYSTKKREHSFSILKAFLLVPTDFSPYSVYVLH